MSTGSSIGLKFISLLRIPARPRTSFSLLRTLSAWTLQVTKPSNRSTGTVGKALPSSLPTARFLSTPGVIANAASRRDRLRQLWPILRPRREPHRAFRALRQRPRSEEHTSELQSHLNLVCRLLLEKKKR